MIRGTGIDSTVKLYLKGNGANGSTKFFDDSQNHKVMTAVGNAQISTTRSKFGGSSIKLDGTGDYVSTPNSDDFTFGTGDFSIAFWVNFNVYGACGIVYQKQDSTNKWSLTIDADRIYFLWTVGGVQVAYYTTNAQSWANDTWYYIVFSRHGSSAEFHRNGVDLTVMEHTAFATLADVDAVLLMGYYPGGGYLNGYIDDFQIIKGQSIDGNIVPTRQRG